MTVASISPPPESLPARLVIFPIKEATSGSEPACSGEMSRADGRVRISLQVFITRIPLSS
jgi:hypothetical protein